MFPEKKKAVSQILSQFKPSSLEPKPLSDGGEADYDPKESLKAIASDIIEAFHAKSADRLVDALCAFLDEHESYDQE